MALFVLILVGVVVAQTWADWRDARAKLVIADWAKRQPVRWRAPWPLRWPPLLHLPRCGFKIRRRSRGRQSLPGFFWSELIFLLCMMGVVILSLRKKRLRLMLLLVGMVVGAFWLGMMLSS